ncbi:MAG: APC family permease [Bryobacterales bacterium]|nr:APC family permease [Bryobacterales bacterium]
MSADAPHLRRVLGLWDLVLYGIVLVQPIAPVPLFGIAQQLSAGHAVTTIVFAMFAMALTAVSYGRMAAAYPSAGSAYTYVSRGLHPSLGFLTGWAMFLDYLLVPLICTIYGAITLTRIVPGVPYAAWVVIFALSMTALNLRGIQFTARASWVLMLVTTGVISAFIFLAVRYLGAGGLVSSVPFHDPATFKLGTVLTATSVAALTYGGFDGVTTLAEEVENPRRNVMLAAVGVVLFTGLFGGLQIYLAQLVWPDYRTFGNLETAFLDVSRKVGGEWMFQSLAVVLIVASFGSALTAQAGVSRLLYSMGRARALPAFFAHLDARTASPVWNIAMVGVMAAAGAMVLNYERSAELINFGAFLAFMGVNAAVMRRRDLGWLSGKVLPAAGFLFCLSIWLNLSRPAMWMGGAWFLAGLVFHLVQRRRAESFVFEE